MTHSDAALQDLFMLAIKRHRSALGTVAQLLETREQHMRLLLAAAADIATKMADEMVECSDGSLSEDDAKAEVIKLIAAVFGFESATMTERQAKKMGLTK